MNLYDIIKCKEADFEYHITTRKELKEIIYWIALDLEYNS